MSLVIYVSTKTVIISKYNLEFRFSPPAEKLTKAALETYRLLRQSELLQLSSSRQQKEEVITLLKHYGLALFKAVIPDHLKPQIYQSGGVFIYSLDKEIIDLPWELLYDGSSFLALTQGVVRINKSSCEEKGGRPYQQLSSLKVSLNSFSPLEESLGSVNFISPVEEIALGGISKSPLIDLTVNGNASCSSMLATMDNSNHIVMFSGFDSKDLWVLNANNDKKNNGFKTEVQARLREAVKKGLRLLILNTSDLQGLTKSSLLNPLRPYFDEGIPHIITVNGRVGRERLKEYLNIFLLGLAREENLLRAHRIAINSIQSSLPLSWDWSWIRLHLNQQLLDAPSEQPLTAFKFDRTHSLGIRKRGHFAALGKTPYSRFKGSSLSLVRLLKQLKDRSSSSIVNLKISTFQSCDSYIWETFRRLSSEVSTRLSMLHYQRWGYDGKNRNRLNKSKYGGLFSFLYDEELVYKSFDRSLIDLAGFEGENPEQHIVIIKNPPKVSDPIFDRWLTEGLENGKRFIILSEGDVACTHRLEDVELLPCSVREIVNAFEDELPEEWIPLLERKLPDHMRDLSILRVIAQTNDKELIHLCLKNNSLETLYQKTFEKVLKSLSGNRMKVFVSLFLLEIHAPRGFIKDLLNLNNIDNELRELAESGLIISDLSFERFWIPVHFQHHLTKSAHLSDSYCHTLGTQLLQRFIAVFDHPEATIPLIEVAFQNCLLKIADIKGDDNPLQRNLQFGKKLSRKFGNRFDFALSISTSLEIALAAKKGQLIQKTLFAIVDTLESLPYKEEILKVCNWLLLVEKKHQNWALVSEIQVKMALVYSQMGKKEKAIGLISSAIKLNNDIKNYAGRYQNLITIALLLLELGDFERLQKLLANADFESSLLNREDMAKLWLIDGHMLFQNERYKAAESSFKKVIEQKGLDIPEALMAKTFLMLAEIYEKDQNRTDLQMSLKRACYYLESTGEQDKAVAVHEALFSLFIDESDNVEAVRHLEWVFDYYRQLNNLPKQRQIADQLGGLYFKIGEHDKSTDFYSIAQGI